jgi:hypothetical protein
MLTTCAGAPGARDAAIVRSSPAGAAVDWKGPQVRYTVEFTFEPASAADAESRVAAMARAGHAEIESETLEQEGGRAILVPQDQFAEQDTDVKTLMISKQDAEVCEKALTVVLNWWDTASELDLLSGEGTADQLGSFPFQRLHSIAERYERTE